MAMTLICIKLEGLQFSSSKIPNIVKKFLD